MTPEQDGWAGEDGELSGLLRDALRAHTPERLTEAQLAELRTASRRRPAMRRIARGAALLALACAVPLAIYLGRAGDERPEPAGAPPPARVQVEQPAQADPAAIPEEALRAAEAAAAEARPDKAAAARAQPAAASPELRSAHATHAQAAAAAAAAELDGGRPRGNERRPRAAVTKAKPSPAGKASSSDRCDQVDPLCGL